MICWETIRTRIYSTLGLKYAHLHRDTPQSKPTLCQPMGKTKRLIVLVVYIYITYICKIHFNFSVCRMYDHREARITWQSIPVLFPDDLAAALYLRGESYFKRCFMPAEDEPKKFWEHCKEHSTWFGTHPMKDFQRLDRLIPFTLYGDDVQCYKNSEVGTISVIGWTSDFAFLNGTLLRYFPICTWSEHCGTEFTYEDIMKHITMRISRMVDPEFIHEWSQGGFAFIFHGISGDLKWIRDQFGLHKFNANECCSSCGAVKDHPDPSMTIADFRPTARHVGTAPDLSSFHAISLVIFTLPGACQNELSTTLCIPNCLARASYQMGPGLSIFVNLHSGTLSKHVVHILTRWNMPCGLHTKIFWHGRSLQGSTWASLGSHQHGFLEKDVRTTLVCHARLLLPKQWLSGLQSVLLSWPTEKEQMRWIIWLPRVWEHMQCR